MRHSLIALALLTGLAGPASAQISLSIGLPNVRIGLNLPLFPQLVLVPGYPVYYAPGVQSNYFYYDGLYWVYENDNWYSSDWYNGPWAFVDPGRVPLFVLRVPVRYYRSPPSYFRGWAGSAPPRWGEHWGPGWQQQRPGWDRWNRGAAPPPAPLPTYQRRYPESRYPQPEQQREVRQQNDHPQPRNPVLTPPTIPRPAPEGRKAHPPEPQGPTRQAEPPREAPRQPQRDTPRENPREVPREAPRSPPANTPQGQPREQAPPGRGPEPGRGKGNDKGNDKGRDDGEEGDRKKPGR